jgi:hypothetical protein
VGGRFRVQIRKFGVPVLLPVGLALMAVGFGAAVAVLVAPGDVQTKLAWLYPGDVDRAKRQQKLDALRHDAFGTIRRGP